MRVKFFSLVFVLLTFGLVAQAQVAPVPDGCVAVRTADGKTGLPLCNPQSSGSVTRSSATRSANYISERFPYISATPPECGKYLLWTWPNPDGTVMGYSCTRTGNFPWYTAGGGWESEIPTRMGPSPTGGGVQISLTMGANAPGTVKHDQLYGGWSGIQTLFVGTTYAGSDGVSRIIQLTGASACDFTDGTINCHQIDGLAIGSLAVQIFAADVPTLEAASASLVFINKTLGWQVEVPLVYDDEASNEWVSNFSETLLAKKENNTVSHNSSFAVLNLSDQPQAVEVSVYDPDGKRIVSAPTPVLVGGLQHPVYPIVFPKGVFAEVLATFFGAPMFPAGVFGNELTGTLRFKGLGGGKIAPLVLRAIGNSITSFEVKAVRQ